MEKQTKKEMSQNLKEIALYLTGVKDGRGNILPLGDIHIKTIYSAIAALRDWMPDNEGE